MNNSKILEIIKCHVEFFHVCVDKELEKEHHNLFDGFGFPMFEDTTKYYHEQVFFQSYLEHYTRNMINGILKELIEKLVPDSDFSWPEFEYKGFYIGYNNPECEKEFGYEFLNNDTGTAYRYVSIPDFDEVEYLLNKHELTSIKIVPWEKDDEPYYDYDDERISTISVSELFIELFSVLNSDEINDLYRTFIDAISNAVKKASGKISLTSLPGFTPSFRHKNRRFVLSSVEKEIKSLRCLHVNNSEYKNIEEDSIRLIDEYGLTDYFLEKGYLGVFVGASNYAKSFLTSEYLYDYFSKNPLFDYTPIVSGYLKSVELLLHKICVVFRNTNNIKKSFRDYTLGRYKDFILENPEIIRAEVRPELEIITNCIQSYATENRNHLFHKDILSLWERVNDIRTNTIFLFAVLLGSIDSSLIDNNDNLLSILRDQYEQLFLILDKKTSGFYTIIIKGKEYSNMEKLPRHEGLSYNNYGLVKNSVSFRRFIYDHYEEVVISPNNMPTEVWVENRYGEKSTRLF